VCLPSSLSPYTHIRVHIHTLSLSRFCTHTCSYAFTYKHIHAHAYTHTHTRTNTRTHTHTHTHNMGSWSVEMYPPRTQIHLHRAEYMIVYVHFCGLEEGVKDAYISSVCVCVCVCVCVYVAYQSAHMVLPGLEERITDASEFASAGKTRVTWRRHTIIYIYIHIFKYK